MPRILIVKTSSLGDVVHNCPAVTDIARHVPGAVIDWVVEEPFAGVVALHRAVRRVIPIAVRRWRGALGYASTWSELAALRRLLRAELYDHVIDSQGLVKSALIGWMARGLRHGFDRESAREPFAARFYDARHAVPTGLHAVERNRRLAAAALGYAVEDGCDYGLSAADTLPIEVREPASIPYALFLTMTSRADKLWPEEQWRSLGATLGARGIQCLLPWGSEEERRRCARIAIAIPGAVVPRRLTLAELASVARKARVVVGVDTGLAHLAAALEVPVVGLYCGSNPALTGLYPGGMHGGKWVRNLGHAGSPPSVAVVLGVLEPLL
jgi:heptosyltransferase-1